MIDAPPAFTCQVAKAMDGDTIRCADGKRVRIAGIQAPDPVTNAPCRQHRAGYVCDLPVLSKSGLKMDKDLACSIVTTGAADWWPMYVRRYNLRRCG